MKYISIFIALLLFLVPTETVQARRVVAPLEHDWSLVKQVGVQGIPSGHEQIIQGPEGDFHLLSTQPIGQDLRIEYNRLSPRLVVMVNRTSAVQDVRASVSYMTAAALNETGPVLIVAVHQENGWLFWAVQLDFQGNIVGVRDLGLVAPGSGRKYQRINGINAHLNNGVLHLIVLGSDWDRGNLYNYYFRFDNQLNSDIADVIGDGGTEATIFRGQVLADSKGNAWVLTALTNSLVLYRVDVHGYQEQFDLGKQAFADQIGPSIYMRRMIPPAMAIDGNDTLHIAWHVNTGYAGTKSLVDVRYMRFKDDTVLSDLIATSGHGVAHFPQLSIFGDTVFLSWQQEGAGISDLLLSVFETDGTPVFQRLKYNFNPAPWGTTVYGSHPGNLTALWWSSRGNNYYIIGQSTHRPRGGPIWIRLGFTTLPGNPLWSQVLWFAATTIMQTFVAFLGNLHVIIVILLFLGLLYRLGLLDIAMARPQLLLAVALPIAVLLLSAPALTKSFLHPAYQVYSAIGATLLLVLGLKMFQVGINTSLSFITGCVAWLILNLMLQIIPTIPYQMILG